MTYARHAQPPRPRKQEALLTKLNSFANGIAADPACFHLNEKQVREIVDAVGAFAKTLKKAADPGTKTQVTVKHKDKARRRAEEVHSKYYNLIKNDPTIAEKDKVGIGVKPVNLERTPIAAPGNVPQLNVIGATPHQHKLRFRALGKLGECEYEGSGKPRGASFIQVYAAIGEGRTQPVSAAREIGLFARNPIVVEHAAENNGKQAVYYARWISTRGEAGRWSLPTSMAIVA